MTSLRGQIILGLLVITAIVGFGAYYLRASADMVKQMPPESFSFMQRAAATFKQNKDQALRKASFHLQDQKQKVIDYLNQKKKKSIPQQQQ